MICAVQSVKYKVLNEYIKRYTVTVYIVYTVQYILRGQLPMLASAD